MLRLPSSGTKERFLALQHQAHAEFLREHLTAERQHLLEALTKAADEATFRRLQGAVLVLGDLLDLLTPRRP